MKKPKKKWLIGAGLLALMATVIALRGRDGATSEKLEPHADPQALMLPPGSGKENPIALARAERTRLAADLEVVGSVSYDEDHYALVGPLVDGRVARLYAGMGDRVRVGQVLAEIESAEIGQAQAAYLSARAKEMAAQANLVRERDLAARHISSDRDREMAEAQAASESADLHAARERLLALGLPDAEIARLGPKGGTGGRVPLRAPISGTVVARSVTLGQAVERASDAFKILDLSHLWVQLDVYEKDLDRVHVGQKVELRTEAYPGEVFDAHVAYVGPIIDEKTRTARVRIELLNPDGKLRPGQFVSARLIGDPRWARHEVLAVPSRAVKMVDGKRLVFVKTGQRFEERTVEIGVSGGSLVEVKHGLQPGDQVVTEGAFLLKSELLR